MKSPSVRKARKKVEERFWSRVNKTDGCWLWMGHTNDEGYGQFQFFKPMSRRAHRVAWYFTTREELPPEIKLCHRCDTPRCVRPSHLFKGSIADNQIDMAKKMRMPWGEQRKNAKLTLIAVKDIRLEYQRNSIGHGYRALARKYGVAVASIAGIIRGHKWVHA